MQCLSLIKSFKNFTLSSIYVHVNHATTVMQSISISFGDKSWKEPDFRALIVNQCYIKGTFHTNSNTDN